MTTVQDVYNAIDSFAPFSSALPWDNSGLQVGDPAAPVAKILVALDATPQVVGEAIGVGAQLIVTHHPVLFEPCRALVWPHPAFLAARANVAVLSAHTNYDLAPEGVNAQLGRALGVAGLVPLPPADGEEEPAACLTGELPREMSPRELAGHLAEALGVAPRYNPFPCSIRRVALAGGAGAGSLRAAFAAGCQALVTGEAKHHHFLEAQALGMVLFDGGHYATEALALPHLVQRLAALCPGVAVVAARQYDGAVLN